MVLPIGLVSKIKISTQEGLLSVQAFGETYKLLLVFIFLHFLSISDFFRCLKVLGKSFNYNSMELLKKNNYKLNTMAVKSIVILPTG